MLSDAELLALEKWVRVANAWSVAAQGLVGAATELTLASRDLADGIGDEARPLAAGDRAASVDRPGLASDLRLLAETVEDENEELRDRYLATAAGITQFGEVLRLP